MDLKSAATSAGLTGRQIAERLGVTPATVSRWLSRKVIVPSECVRDLADMLLVDPTEILPPPRVTLENIKQKDAT